MEKEYFIHESSYVDDDVEIGAGTKIWFFCHLQKGARIGKRCSLGQNVNVSNTHTFTLPIQSSYFYKHKASYTFKTTERISTSNSPYFVGQDADIYIGTVNNVYSRRMDAVQPIDSMTYALLAARTVNGSMPRVAEGVDSDGKRYYLVVAQELEVGPYVAASFAYTHSYIENTLIPQLEHQRDALLLTCDSATAQSIANAQLKPAYYSLVAPSDSNWACDSAYRWLLPEGVDGSWANEVDSLNRVIADWYSLLLQNEQEKVSAIHNNAHELVATHSVSSGATVARTESYAYSNAYTVYWDFPGANTRNCSITSQSLCGWQSLAPRTTRRVCLAPIPQSRARRR